MERPSDRLRRLRRSRRISQVMLSELCGLGSKSVGFYEQGGRPGADALIALADYFDTSIDYLLCRTDNPARPPSAAPRGPGDWGP